MVEETSREKPHVEGACGDRSAGEGPSRWNCHNKELGRRGEAAAGRYLEHLGFEIVERNWECPAGEADIIAWDSDWLTFVEVKTRTNLEKGFPAEAVTPNKRQRYEKIAAWYLKDHMIYDTPVRFDIVELLVVAEDRALVRHIGNAFGAA